MMAEHPYSFADDQVHNGLGGPVQNHTSKTFTGAPIDPLSRDDIPPMHRIGMPLYNPAFYDAPADPNVVDGEVVDDDKSAIGSGSKSGTVAKTGGK